MKQGTLLLLWHHLQAFNYTGSSGLLALGRQNAAKALLPAWSENLQADVPKQGSPLLNFVYRNELWFLFDPYTSERIRFLRTPGGQPQERGARNECQVLVRLGQ